MIFHFTESFNECPKQKKRALCKLQQVIFNLERYMSRPTLPTQALIDLKSTVNDISELVDKIHVNEDLTSNEIYLLNKMFLGTRISLALSERFYGKK